jgi:hypothetical protein
MVLRESLHNMVTNRKAFTYEKVLEAPALELQAGVNELRSRQSLQNNAAADFTESQELVVKSLNFDSIDVSIMLELQDNPQWRISGRL